MVGGGHVGKGSVILTLCCTGSLLGPRVLLPRLLTMLNPFLAKYGDGNAKKYFSATAHKAGYDPGFCL
ncbi:Rho-Related Gtp-Binding Protein Rhov [Manis pentadactyla]|nr:Rho-Related Gtp-Binding Protein Rhov [Manis pentadactyla]